jgi:hypothetical protein
MQLVNGKIYAAWGPNCGTAPDSGWVMSFDAPSLNPSGSLYLASASGLSAPAPGFTVSGLSADSAGDLYVFGQASYASHAPGSNGTLVPASNGNAFLKLSTSSGLALLDYSKTTAPTMTSLISAGSSPAGAAIVLPDFTDDSGKVWHLALGAGGDGSIFLLNRDSLGGAGLQSTPILQVVWSAVSSAGGTSALAYFNGAVYHSISDGQIKDFALSDARLSTTPVNQTNSTLGASGAQLSISAKGTNRGILWALENDGAGILHAYDAADLSRELYNSTQASNSRDGFATAGTAVSPTIAGGRVYVVTKNGIVVFGQLK